MTIQKKVSRCDLLAEASALTSQDRNKDYGDPVDNMTHIADIFNAITGHQIKPSDVAILHIATKLARKRTSPLKKDHYVDTMAYMGIAYECELEENSIEPTPEQTLIREIEKIALGETEGE